MEVVLTVQADMGAMSVGGDVETILVVDDDDNLLANYGRCLDREYRVRLARTIAEARRHIRECVPDVAIVDLCLRCESGIDFIEELRAECAGTFIVLISGWASIESAVVAMRAGANDVLTKPVTVRELMQRVLRVRGDSTRSRRSRDVETPTLARAQWEHIQRVLTDCDGNISLAARRLGIYRSSLQRRLKKQAPNV